MAHDFRRHRAWLLVMVVIAALAMHGVVLHYAYSHRTVSATIGAGILALLLVKHTGLLGLAFRGFRKAKARAGTDQR